MQLRRLIPCLLVVAAAMPGITAGAHAAPGDLTILNRLPDGSRPDGEVADETPDLSGDGSRVVFATTQALEPSDDNDTADVYLWDKASGLQRVSRTPDGSAPAGASFSPAISTDGRYVVFVTHAIDIVDSTLDACPRIGQAHGNYTTTAACGDVVRVDTLDWSSELLTPPSGVEEVDISFLDPDVNGTGSVVTFVEDSTLGATQVRVWTEESGLEMQRVSSYASGEPAELSAGRPRVSRTGRWIVFESRSALTGDDTDDVLDVFRYDRATASLTLVSRPHPTEFPGIAPMHNGITADGTVIYESATVSCTIFGNCHWWSELFARSVSGHLTTVLSDYGYYQPSGDGEVSDDGRYVLQGSTHHAYPDDPPRSYATRFDRVTREFMDVYGFGALSGDGSHVAGEELDIYKDPYANYQWWGHYDVFVQQLSMPAPPPSADDLSVSWAFAASPVRTRTGTSLQVAVDNVGSTTADGATLEINLDSSTTVLGIPSNCTATRSTVRCELPTLAAGESSLISFGVSYKRAGTVTHEAVVSWSPDGDPTNSTAVQQVTVTG